MKEAIATQLPAHANFKDITGKRFGRLLVLGLSASTTKNPYKWVCQCDCGEIRLNLSGTLNCGASRSCGCLMIEFHTTHGATVGQLERKPCAIEYNSWKNMRSRCANPNRGEYPQYGGRGITVCERWQNSFENFLEDMGPRPEGTTLDRHDNDKGYSPENCRWATKKEQQRNRRCNKLITFNGMTKCVSEWAECLRIKDRTLRTRLSSGLRLEDALNPSYTRSYGC